ncbi:hypothetical protein [Planococcus shenhongbingii]|uniref:Uncharacterized protein n=1 Tax=Planococcus shenhongbingii TaxID=3058398 RepID=A0ABT8NH71_9BACL|nr:hypothetical protein [Planococcus sp. N017]MDN7247176.1 hypothetical protein [Planococcus sp. N017]
MKRMPLFLCILLFSLILMRAYDAYQRTPKVEEEIVEVPYTETHSKQP